VDDDRSQPGTGRTWQTAVAILGGAAGLSLFVVTLGAGALWVRLDAVGLPTERGVAVTSRQTLAVLGMHKLVEPLVLAAIPVALVLWRLGIGPTTRGTLQLGRAAHDANFKRRLRRICAAALLGACVFWVLAPFTPTFAVLTATIVFPVGVAYLVAIRGHYIRLSSVRRAIVVYVALIVTAVALTTEAEPPSILEHAAVSLKSGGTANGYFVGEDSGAVYLGNRDSILTIPHEEVVSVRVGSATHTSWFGEHPPLIVRAVDAIDD
jgi:hypothetical protein